MFSLVAVKLRRLKHRTVQTTYEVLRHDLKFEASQGSGRSRRHAVKYPFLPTPLTKLTWWRVVLDEVRTAAISQWEHLFLHPVAARIRL